MRHQQNSSSSVAAGCGLQCGSVKLLCLCTRAEAARVHALRRYLLERIDECRHVVARSAHGSRQGTAALAPLRRRGAGSAAVLQCMKHGKNVLLRAGGLRSCADQRCGQQRAEERCCCCHSCGGTC